MMEILVALLSAVVTGVSGCLVYFLKSHFKKVEKFTEDAEERRTQKDVLVLKSLKAIGELAMANATAVKNGHCNGEMDKAQKEFESVDKELHAFLMESAAQAVRRGKR